MPPVQNAVHGEDVQLLPGGKEVGVIAQGFLVAPQDGCWIEIEFLCNSKNGVALLDHVGGNFKAGAGWEQCAKLCQPGNAAHCGTGVQRGKLWRGNGGCGGWQGGCNCHRCTVIDGDFTLEIKTAHDPDDQQDKG